MTFPEQRIFALVLWSLALNARATLVTGEHPEHGLRFWRLEERGIFLELVQRLPDQTRAFFQARGFPRETADAIALGCVFQTIFRNTGEPRDGAVSYDLRDWRVVIDGEHRPIRLKEDWSTHWPSLDVSKSAQIAFRWSFLPTRQRFEPGDYNWGMTSYGLKPGVSFDLKAVWYHAEARETAHIPSIRCAPDVRTLEEPRP